MTKKYLNVSYKDRELAKKLGARWDPSVKRWYCPSGSALATIFDWRKEAQAEQSLKERGYAAREAKVAHNQNFELPLAS
ncbi:DUF5710 domain-containing protein [Litorimonas haliclonae]|uniref:DUF5710 domain-containing protein n=1 Tax=Litorimonas haliclonae TaxID=2081977 RepID=UPI0039EE6B0F